MSDYIDAPHGSSPAGPCAFCGHPDKRHRMWDAIKGRFAAGDSIEDIAVDYGFTRADTEQWLRLAITEPKRRSAKTGQEMLPPHPVATGAGPAPEGPK